MPIYKMDGKKEGLQKYRVRINYKDAFGKKRQLDRVCYGRAEALELERRLMQKDEKPIRSFRELFDAYLDHERISVRQTTFANVEKNLRLYVLPVYESAKLSDLSTASLLRWKTEHAKRGLSLRTNQNAYAAFSALLNWASKVEFIQDNPLRKIGNYREAEFTAPAEKLHYYTAEQYLKFAACARADAERMNYPGYFTFFSIAYYTGARKGEINALRWSDLDGKFLHIRRSVNTKLKGVPLLETPPKNKSSYRDLQLPAPLLEVLEAARAYQSRDPAFNESFRICGGAKCLSDTQLENKNKQFAAAAGLPKIKIHDFRHSHASLLANEGINIQEIARRLGHSDVKTTWETYAHLYPREEERAVAILDRVK